jgi:hypothetical protein
VLWKRQLLVCVWNEAVWWREWAMWRESRWWEAVDRSPVLWTCVAKEFSFFSW